MSNFKAGKKLGQISLPADLRNKFSEKMETGPKEDFTKNLKIINKQINQIENLVNEFSDFARMPKPILKDNNLVLLIKENINLLKELDNKILIKLDFNNRKIILKSDNEQLSRVFLNIIKNSIESIQEKMQNNIDFVAKIDIAINDMDDYIDFTIIDNGKGFDKTHNNIKDILNPYFTTKKKGTGLGLAIVNKIINDHNGKISFKSLKDGAKINIKFIR